MMTNLKSIFIEINFTSRLKEICSNHNDFDSRLRGNNRPQYDEVLRKLDRKFKYIGRETFYKIEDQAGHYTTTFHLVLKNGIVEPILYIKYKGQLCSPYGRLDFMPERMGVEFDRIKYNIPKYVSFDELEGILVGLFGIYDDLWEELEKVE